MKHLPFRKMHGAGNDFVMIDAADLARAGVRLDRALIARLCNRRLGIGGDGLIVLHPDPENDFGMAYYNADGGEAGMCGNGARCAFLFARDRGRVGDRGIFTTGAGPIEGEYVDGDVRVDLTPPTNLQTDPDLGLEHPFPSAHLVDTGVPHLVLPVETLETIDLPKWGPLLRHAPALGAPGANVNWVQERADGTSWLIRTYERGVEGETLACGTGSSAAAVILVHLGMAASPVSLLTRGGYHLNIDVTGTPEGGYALRLRGPATTVFEGEAALDD